MDETSWITCPGCSGEIGVPPDWPADVVCCPKCSGIVRIDERLRVLWRPNSERSDTENDQEQGDHTRWIPCHACTGDIGVPPSWLGPTVACPKCGAIVAIKETSRVLWRPPAENISRSNGGGLRRPAVDDDEPGAWKKPVAAVMLTLGGLAFFSSAVIGGQGSITAGLVSGLLNPLFFVGVPLGWYWLRSARAPSPSSLAEARSSKGSEGGHDTPVCHQPSIPAVDSAASDTEGRINWRRQAWDVGIIFFALVFIGAMLGATSGSVAPTVDDAMMSLAIFAFVGWGIVALVSLGCWWVLLTRMFEHGHTLLAATIFLALPVSYVPAFLYGWAHAKKLSAERTMLVWTYCFVIALCLPAACLAGFFCVEFQQRRVEAIPRAKSASVAPEPGARSKNRTSAPPKRQAVRKQQEAL